MSQADHRLVAEVERRGVVDPQVLDAIDRVPREIFLPDLFQDRAHEDVALPIGRQQTISQPSVVARMTEALGVTDRTKVLEIGTGSGYQTAVLAMLCRRVYTIERHRPLLREAQQRLDALGVTNVTAKHGDGSLGWPEQAPFERILVTAAAADVPDRLLAQLAPGGVMIIPIGLDERDQRLYRVRRLADEVDTEDLGAIRFVPLVPGLADD